ncbi:porphobilinogen deaminase [Sanghuangporus baumii]|uniref:Porphobilinogen deaminase n=1 Tax=Sanghuangporus baumii TaxID=108892 RepID=A0A9Q5I0E3_SANBA|nr:porphobilinogen deaminase [Sanghuangporus baumii]
MTAITEKKKPTLTFTLASRASQLAQIQTHIVRDALIEAFPSTSEREYVFETEFMRTAGDKNQAQALYVLGGAGSGGKSLWTEELEAALLTAAPPPAQSREESATTHQGGEDGEDEKPRKRVDMLVHSLKDVPTTLPPGCEIGAILEREDPVDSLVVKQGLPYKSLDELPDGSVVGTSSVRRVAQLRRNYPKLQFADVRGNLNTRMAKLDAPDGPYSALILAKAGLVRLGMGGRITTDVSAPILYHAVGQGALAVEIRAGDEEVLALCKALNHPPTERCCRAERAMLKVLEGGCSVPVGVHTQILTDGKLRITGTVTALDGLRHVEHTLEEAVSSAREAEAVGEKLAKILIETGAREILDEIAKDKERRKAAEAAMGQTAA